MKRNGWKEALAAAICACTVATGAATAQVSIGSSSNAVQSSLSSSSGYSVGHDTDGSQALSASITTGSDESSESLSSSAFVINRFGYKDGQIVAYGRLVPSVDAELEVGGGSLTGGTSSFLFSTPIEPAGGYGSDPRLGAGSRLSYSDARELNVGSSLASGSSSSWITNSSSLSSGSSLSSATSSGTIGWSGSSTFDDSRLGSWTGIGTGYGESGVESRSTMTSDIDGTTSFNLGRPYDDVSYMEDITWSGWSDLDSSLAWSANQEMLGDLELGLESSGSERSTLLRLGDDSEPLVQLRESGQPVLQLNDGVSEPLVELRSDSRPLVQLGGSTGLYELREAERAAMLMSSEDIPIPVTVVSASCDAVSLSFGGVETVTYTSAMGGEKLGTTLCALSEASETHITEGQSAQLVKHLNRLISRFE